jgi:hypothetical protein
VSDATWTWDDMYCLLTSPGGYLDRIPAGVPPLLVLTQLASLADSIGLFAFVDRVMTTVDLPLVVCCELAGDQPHIQTVYATDNRGANDAK